MWYTKKKEVIKIDKKELLHRFLLLGAVILFSVAFILLVPEFKDINHITFSYHVLEDGTLSLEGCSSTPSTLKIPSEIDGKKVTEIYSSSFSGADSLKKVVIPETVTKIAPDAFYNCKKLKTVVLSEGIIEIGGEAFSECSFLEKINLPDSLKEIGPSAFAGCTRLSSLKIPKGCTSIGDFAFLACERLVLDVSENDLAKSFSEEYNIPTGYKNSMSDFYTKLAISVASAVLLTVVVIIVISKIKKRKAG